MGQIGKIINGKFDPFADLGGGGQNHFNTE